MTAALPALGGPAATDAGAAPMGDMGNPASVAAGPQLPESDDDAGAGLPEWMELSDGRFSPEPVDEDAVPAGAELVDEQDDRDLLTYLRRQVHTQRLSLCSCDCIGRRARESYAICTLYLTVISDA